MARGASASASILFAFIVLCAGPARAVPVLTFYEGSAADPAGIAPVRDTFRLAVGGGTVAGANGSFGGLRREINWDGVPASLSDPNLLPGNFFNTTSPRGAVFTTPGTGFLVSANAGLGTPTLFGFPSDFQTFSPQKLFTAVNSNITDVRFFVPGTSIAGTTTGFGALFVDVELPTSSRLEFYDASDALLESRAVPSAGNQSLSFLGLTVSGGSIGRVRIVSGANTIVLDGVLGNPVDDVVVMDDFIYAEPLAALVVPEPGSLVLLGAGLALASMRRRKVR